jgi:lantibiotic modifying enzyme
VRRLARNLRVFLEKRSSKQIGRSRRRPTSFSIDEALAPAVRFGVGELQKATPSAAKRILANSVWDDLSRHLSGRLSLALTPTLRLHQKAARAVARSMEAANRKRTNAWHDQIILLETINEFPDLLETTARLICAWIDAQQELFVRLIADKVELCSIFLRRPSEFRVIAVRPGLSDPHDGGRTVTLIEFSGNSHVIYKPRSCEGEQLWFAALSWLNRNGIAPTFRTSDLLSRKNYCWMEFLSARGCRNSNAVRLFYFRWGAQASLAEILAMSDLHQENWIAAGPQPILVDAEMVRTGRQDQQSLPALLETGLLPLVSRDRVGRYRGIAPFDVTLPETAALNCWPRYKSKLQPPWKYLSDLVRGFEAVTEIFAKPDSVRKFFREVIFRSARIGNARMFFRASAEYARLLRESLEATHMIARSRRWHWLMQECIALSPNRSVAMAEARALLRCDLPKFVVPRRAASWKQFSAAVVRIRGSAKLLRRRVLLGVQTHRR